MLLDKNQDGEPSELEVNMTPLIDVSLVLVVILLLLTPLALESGILFHRDQAQITEETPAAVLPLLELHVLSEQTVEVAGRAVARESLLDVLGPLMQGQEYRGVAIDCAGWITHGVFVNVLDQARLSGATEIAVAGQ